MREIIFRGKRFKDGEWVEGVYVCDPQEKNEHQIYVTHTHPCGCCLIPYSVIPETVGQYTGLKDKNGKMIFEGDIVTAEGTAIGSPFFDDMVGKIVYEECAFFIEPKNPEESIYLFTDECADIEVIGNIHDNGELLKGE